MDGVRVLTGFRALHLIRNLSIALKFVRVEPTGIMPIQGAGTGRPLWRLCDLSQNQAEVPA